MKYALGLLLIVTLIGSCSAMIYTARADVPTITVECTPEGARTVLYLGYKAGCMEKGGKIDECVKAAYDYAEKVMSK